MEKIKTSKQRILVAILTLCMLFTLFAPAANVNAASKRTKALTAYQKKLTRLDSRYNKFALIYLDKDSIPELLITPKETVHIATSDVYVYTGGKLKKLKYAGSDYGAVATFYRFKKNGKKTKLKKFEEIANPTALFKINGKKVSKQKYNAQMKKIEKKYPLKQIWSFDTFELTTDNINNLVKNYKSFIITGKKF